MARRIAQHFIQGPAGRLEALLEEPEDRAPVEAALVCHPHPLYGGSMHNKVVYRLARGLRRSGSVVLRFNFRGVGRSEGEHAHGAGEIEDARAALEWLCARYPDLPRALAGFSFGARVVMQLGCSMDPPPARVILAGFPTRLGGLEYLRHCTAPKSFIQSTRDEHGPRSQLEPLFQTFADPKRLYWVDAADHFFGGGLDDFENLVFRLER
ncbi:MAG: alpha/beta hydrolase [Acidobacteria bacterium]|nr:alpha/beta hydrolase [Acidobacteriota bacterium]